MLTVSVYQPPFTHEIDLHDIPEEFYGIIHQAAIDDEYNQFNYHDGDYHYMLNLNQIPCSLDPESAEGDVWNEFIEYLREELSAYVFQTNRLAIWISQ